MSGVEEVWAALDDLMEQLNKPIKGSKKSHNDLLSGFDQARMDREKMKGEATGLARAIAILTDTSVEDVRQAAIARYVGE